MSIPSTPETTPSPSGLPRGLLILLGTAAAFVTMFGIRSLSDFIGPVFLALVLVVAVHPVREWCDKRGIPGVLGMFIAMIAVYAILVVLALSMVIAGARFATLLTQYQPEFNSFVHDVNDKLKGLGISEDQIHAMTGSLDPSKLVGIAADLIGGVAGLLGNLFFIIVLIFFMVADAGGFPGKLRHSPAERSAVVDAFGSFARGTRQYLVVATVFGLIVAALDVVALYALGIPDPWLWGLLAFITNYIPNIGFIIGLIPPAIIALLDQGPGTAIAVIVVYCALNVVIQTVIQPKVVGDAVGLSGTLTFLSLIFWASILGAVGALFAVPLSLFVKALLVDTDPSTRWISPLLNGGKADDAEPDVHPLSRSEGDPA